MRPIVRAELRFQVLKYLLERGLNQQEFADSCEIQIDDLTHVMKCDGMASIQVVEKICNALSITLQSLLIGPKTKEFARFLRYILIAVKFNNTVIYSIINRWITKKLSQLPELDAIRYVNWMEYFLPKTNSILEMNLTSALNEKTEQEILRLLDKVEGDKS